jgi:hypothetical protein
MKTVWAADNEWIEMLAYGYMTQEWDRVTPYFVGLGFSRRSLWRVFCGTTLNFTGLHCLIFQDDTNILKPMFSADSEPIVKKMWVPKSHNAKGFHSRL